MPGFDVGYKAGVFVASIACAILAPDHAGDFALMFLSYMLFSLVFWFIFHRKED